jgi:transposase
MGGIFVERNTIMDEEKQQQQPVVGHKKYQRFDEAFKREAVRLSQLDGRTVAGTARSLGIDTNTLGMWRRQFGASISETTRTGSYRSEAERDGEKDREIMDLRKRLREAEIERDILKKAVGVISRPPP